MADVSTPVLIVGGGPVGLAASIALARLGVPSLLVEQHAGTTTHPKATVVNTRTFELFRQWGIADAVRAGGLPPDRSRFIVWATTLTGWELGRLDLTPPGTATAWAADARHPDGQSPCFTGICPQDVYEPILRRAAESFPIASLRFATTLDSFRADEDGVDARIRSADGRTQTVRARWLLACDGAASPIRETLGIRMLGPDDVGSILNVYFHADLGPYVEGREGALYWIVNAETPGVFIALDNRTRWLFNMPYRPAAAAPAHFTAERCTAIVRRAAGDPALAVDVRSIDPWIMRSQVAERWRVGPVFVLGDAAHRFPPTGGFGMNTGVQDAHNLAWKLAGVLAGWASPALLDTYEAERRPVAQANADQSLANSRQMPRPRRAGDANPLAAIEDDSPDGAAVRELVAGGIGRTREHFSAQGQAKGFAYASSAIASDESPAGERDSTVADYVPSARPGCQAPHAWLRTDGTPRSVLDLFGERFVLLVGPDGGEWTRAARDVPALPLDVHTVGTDVVLDGSDWCSLYGVDADGAVLVRPDGHVAWRRRGIGTTSAAELHRACALARGAAIR